MAGPARPERTGSPPFDVESFRPLTARVARVREVATPTLVLGSTQPESVVRRRALARREVTLVRRRSGGGAVYLAPGAQLWVDVWLPRRDPLWDDDVAVAAEWVGQWWAHTLRGSGIGALEVHGGRARPGTWGRLVCFAGRGPGEVFHGERKVVGLSQWRAREGALFSSCAYGHWDPAPLTELLEADVAPIRLAEDLASAATGLADLAPMARDLGALADRLLAALPAFPSR